MPDWIMAVEQASEVQQQTEAGLEADRAEEARRNECPSCATLRERVAEVEKELEDLREAVSPSRLGNAAYYIGVAQRMRKKETVIRPMRGTGEKFPEETYEEGRERTATATGCKTETPRKR